VYPLRLSRSSVFGLTLSAAFLLPLAIPNVGLDIQYFFVMVVVLAAWFIIKWDAVKKITEKGSIPEMIAGCAIILADYAYNAIKVSTIGVDDMIVIFFGVIVLTYGIRSLKLFWVPLVYGLVLLSGYQIEKYAPNYTALQDWLAGVMATAVNALGIGATVTGDIVTMNLPNGSPIYLELASACTGLQGILAFGMLSTMTLLDMKPRWSRIIPIFVIGFAGAFLINIVRLIIVFLTFEYFGIAAGTSMHVYFGYLIFVAWVLVFWAIAFKYLVPKQTTLPAGASIPTPRQPSFAPGSP